MEKKSAKKKRDNEGRDDSGSKRKEGMSRTRQIAEQIKRKREESQTAKGIKE
jgi:hypothetical protein